MRSEPGSGEEREREVAERYKRNLLTLFRLSPEGKTFLAEHPDQKNLVWIPDLIDFGLMFHNTDVADMDAGVSRTSSSGSFHVESAAIPTKRLESWPNFERSFNSQGASLGISLPKTA